MGVSAWRLIPCFETSGSLQMAIDAWLLDQHQQGLQPSTLRFYTWNPVAISLGYHQRQYPDRWSHLTWQGQSIDLVPRPTGGRAVLHQGDLTYAVITSGLEGNRRQIYRSLCQFLIEGWRSLGVDLYYGRAGRGYIHNPNCFGTATDADLVTADGAKLIGSAQRYQKAAVLQHGSIRLEPDAELFRQVFDQEPLLPELSIALAGEPLYETVIAALTQAAQQCFGMTLVPKPLTPEEWQSVDRFTPSSTVTHPAQPMS